LTEQWKKDRVRGAWVYAWVFALLFHQLLIPGLSGSQFQSNSFIVVSIIFGVITFFFTWTFLLMPLWLVAIVLFIFGALMELYIFNVIVDPIQAGFFYIAMFFIPRWISRRRYKAPEDEQAE
jgi:Flp pilus assembly protein TadB